MMKRSLFPSLAAGLLASLAFATPSHAGSVSYSYSIGATNTTLTATSTGGGSASATVKNATPSTGTGTAPAAPALVDSYITVATYTETATGTGITFPNGIFNPPHVSGGYFNNQSVTVPVTITYMGHSGVIDVIVNFNGLAYANNPVTPGITTTGGPLTLDGLTFSVYEQGTSFNNNTQVSSVKIGIENSAIPEPNSMALLGIGMAGFFTYRRLFKRPAAV